MKILNKYKDTYQSDQVTYIGRGSVWGNAKVIGKDGTREEVIAWYDKHLVERICRRDPVIISALQDLNEESQLLCFCEPQPCHGRVIKRIWEEIHQYPTFEEGLKMFIEKHAEHKVHDPTKDGIDHINIYSKGKTGLGRLLTNFAATPFTFEPYGSFKSVEGFWYWLSTGKQYHILRELDGFNAKQLGKTYERVECPDFQEIIKQALRCKLEQNSYIIDEMLHTELPFAHYYCYGKPPDHKVIEPKEHLWLVDFFEEIRNEYRIKRSQHH